MGYPMNSRWFALTLFDKVLEMIGAVGLILLLLITVINYGNLPETIPIHFNLGGEPDRYGSRATILILPAAGVLLYTILLLLPRKPGLLNFPVPVTPQNRTRMFQLASQMLRLLRVSVVILFLIILTSTIQIANGQSERLSMRLVPYYLLLLIPVLGFYLYKMIQLHREPEAS